MYDPPAPALFAASSLACLRGERMIFAGLTFTMQPGDALFLLGPNGSGKSSLLRVLAGLLKPFAGDMLWQGDAVRHDPGAHAARAHYVGHHDAIKPVLTVGENLRFWDRLHGGDDARRTDIALERFGLSHLRDTPGKMLSAGQKRRANLARMLAAPAPLWLLDEPSVALDRASVAGLEAVIADHRREGGIVLLSTHADILVPGAGVLQMDQFRPAAASLWDDADDDDQDDSGETTP